MICEHVIKYLIEDFKVLKLKFNNKLNGETTKETVRMKSEQELT